MSIFDAEVIESEVLPIVLAFAAGVLMHSICADYRDASRLIDARNTIHHLQVRADECNRTYSNAYIYPQEVSK